MADNLTTFKRRLSRNLGASTSWNPVGLSRPVVGLLYLYLTFLWGVETSVLKRSTKTVAVSLPLTTCLCPWKECHLIDIERSNRKYQKTIEELHFFFVYYVYNYVVFFYALWLCWLSGSFQVNPKDDSVNETFEVYIRIKTAC
jgi:hypothetical protein